MKISSGIYLVLASVKVIHINQRYDIAILMIVKENSNFIKQQLDVKLRSFFVQLVVHHNLNEFSQFDRNDIHATYSTLSCNRLEYKLMVRSVAILGYLHDALDEVALRREKNTRAVNFSTASVYGKPAILAESVSK